MEGLEVFMQAAMGGLMVFALADSLSRPDLEAVRQYRQYVDEHVEELIAELQMSDDSAARDATGKEPGSYDRARAPRDRASSDAAGSGLSSDARWREMIVLGLHHEQQHQELILTDIKHAFSRNPLRPVYRAITGQDGHARCEMAWSDHDGGLLEVGAAQDGDFAFDNEGPRHKVHVEPFQLANRLVTNGEFLGFVEDGGYGRAELWLSDAWDIVRREGWRAPLYWEADGGTWRQFTLHGLEELGVSEPVCHVSYYEADAFARWAGARLASEQEWEAAASSVAVGGNLLETGRRHPARSAAGPDKLAQLFGDVWEWTSSPYVAYPRYRAPSGALGEYNGKFMSNQMVLRGGSCATPRAHLRPTYRNFFPPEARWQFSGFRLARDGSAA